MLTTAEMNNARAVQELTMLNTASIQRPTTTSDGMGGTTQAWQSIGESKCRIAINAGKDAIVLAGQIRERAPWRVTFPALTDVRVSDRLIVGDVYLEVVGVSGPSTFETARIALCADT